MPPLHGSPLPPPPTTPSPPASTAEPQSSEDFTTAANTPRLNTYPASRFFSTHPRSASTFCPRPPRSTAPAPPADTAEPLRLEDSPIATITRRLSTRPPNTYFSSTFSFTDLPFPLVFSGSNTTIRPSPTSYLAAPSYSPAAMSSAAMPSAAISPPPAAMSPAAMPSSTRPPTPTPPASAPPPLTRTHLAALTASPGTKPLFLYNALTLPHQLSRLLHGARSPSAIAALMAPATLYGYERLAVKWADFPAVVAAAEGVKGADDDGVGVGSAEDSLEGMGGEMEGGAQVGLTKKTVETVDGMVVFLTAEQRERVDEEEGLLFELRPVTVEVLVLESEGAVGKVLVEAETYVWDGARASLWEEEKAWTLEGYLTDLAGWGMDGGGDGDGKDGEVDVWGVDGMDAGGRVEGDEDWGILIPHERWFPEEGGEGPGEGSGVLYEGLFGLP